jgi:DNA (cytosine-5)-methyltransferase 1
VTSPIVTPESIINIRKKLSLGRTEFANLLGLGNQGERTVRGWESGEHTPSAKKVKAILDLSSRLKLALEQAPFVSELERKSVFTFIDLFAGIGGIRLPFQLNGGKCVFSSEWDKFAQKTYLANFGEIPHGDITGIQASDVPDHDVLLAGFPCQAFSQAGLKKGFNDTRGTMFFEIQRIVAEKKPKVLLLENVKQLRSHDKGNTLRTIESILRGDVDQKIPISATLSPETQKALTRRLNYWVDHMVLRAADFGVPQNRERVYIVAFDRDVYSDTEIREFFKWPVPPKTPTRLSDILEDLSKLDDKEDVYTISDKLWLGHQNRKLAHKKRGNGFGYSLFDGESAYTNTLSARYYKDGSEILIDQTLRERNPRKLTPRECARLQGFPEKFLVNAVSKGQMYKQFGNSVCVNVVSAIAVQIISFMRSSSLQK